jgi:hypothetical protein
VKQASWRFNNRFSFITEAKIRLVHLLKKSVFAKLIFHLLKQSPSKNLQKEIASLCLLAMTRCLRIVIATDKLSAARACLGWPPKGFLLFLDKKKQNSRLGTDVGLARRNLNGGSTRARFGL